MHITISALPLARLDGVEFCFQSCRLPDYFIGFTFSLQPCRLPEYQSTTLPLVRLYYIDFTYQPCHLPDYIALFSFYSRAFAKLYLAGFSLQSCHSSDLMALVSSYSRATSQALFHRFQFAVLTLVRLYFMVTVSSSPRVALLSDAKDRPIEEKQPGQGIRGTTRRPDHVRLSACQEGLEGSATAGPPPGHQQSSPSTVGAEPAWMDQLLDKLDSRIQTAVNEALNARQAAVSSTTVPAAPTWRTWKGQCGRPCWLPSRIP